VPDFALPAGSYWFGLAIGTTSSDPNATSWFVASTTGANGVGGPLGDDQSIYFQSVNNGSIVNWNYTDSATVNPGFREVPEPATVILLSLAAIGAASRRRRAA
jgi:hypothetical protein